MGRYYDTGNGRDGKFCFALQASDAPENFGMITEEPGTHYGDYGDGYLYYSVDKRNFDYEYYLELCEAVGLEPGDEKGNPKGTDMQNCEYYLGTVIFLDIKETGECALRAEL